MHSFPCVLVFLCLMQASADATAPLAAPPQLQQSPCIGSFLLDQGRSLADQNGTIGDTCLYEIIRYKWVEKKMESNLVNRTQSVKHLFDRLFIEELPPVELGNKLKIVVNDVKINTFFTHPYHYEHIMVNGFLDARWQDNRLSWKGKNYIKSSRPYINLDSVKTQPSSLSAASLFMGASHQKIWLPGFHGYQHVIHVTAAAPFDERKSSRVYEDGKVVMGIEFHKSQKCDMNFDHFPHDEHNCCLSLKPKMEYQGKLDVVMPHNEHIMINKKALTNKEWIFHSITSTWKTDLPEGDRIEICAHIQRSGFVYKYTITMPLTICAILAAVVPLCGGWKFQIVTQTLTILFLALFGMIIHPYFNRFGPSAPKYLRVVDVLLWINTASLLFTLMLRQLSGRTRTTPPSQNLLAFSHTINNRCCCCTRNSENNQSTFQTDGVTLEEHSFTEESRPNGNSALWKEVFLAVNNVSLMMVGFVYVVALFVFL